MFLNKQTLSIISYKDLVKEKKKPGAGGSLLGQLRLGKS
jgi:hypothetical protein